MKQIKLTNSNFKNLKIMSDSGKVLIGVLAGAAAGIVTGVLLAPASGKDTRENISSKTDELLTNVKEILNKQKEQVEEKVGEMKNKTASKS
ncbi:MAG: YtxH domain-containing protein [Bacteroidales bacterium]|nr:YtxH domain-containing protein [Bacteroidales bacterium]